MTRLRACSLLLALMVLTTTPGAAQAPGRGYEPIEPSPPVREAPIPNPGPIPETGRLADPPRRFRLAPKSGKIPAQCQAIAQLPSGAIVDCWLEHHAKVASAMVWAFSKGDIRNWPTWPEFARQDLREAFVAAREWKKAGMTNFQGIVVADPAENLEAPYFPSGAFRTVLADSDAWPLYVNYLGMSLAAEIDAWVNWTIVDYDDEALTRLVSGFTWMFDPSGQYPDVHSDGYVLTRDSLPTNPIAAYKFLADHDLIGDTSVETIALVLEWARANLSHVIGGATMDRYLYTWQYPGRPPASRVIEGTTSTDPGVPAGFKNGPRHWTDGCFGTTDFLWSILRAVNIPVSSYFSPENLNHSSTFFVGEKLYLTHGDDPYNRGPLPTSPTSWLLVDEPTFKKWFKPGVIPGANVGRRPAEIAVWHPSEWIVAEYCQDVASGARHADGMVFEHFKRYFTLSQVENTNLWERLAQRAVVSSEWACKALP